LKAVPAADYIAAASPDACAGVVDPLTLNPGTASGSSGLLLTGISENVHACVLDVSMVTVTSSPSCVALWAATNAPTIAAY